MTAIAPAIAFAVLALAPASVQIALALGAPLGHLTMGGRWPGSLPGPARMLALVQAGALWAMAAVLLAVATGSLPVWASLPVAAVMALSVVAHVATPSPAERRLWLPVVTGMLAFALATGWLAAGGRFLL